jgi:hypothetical protein
VIFGVQRACNTTVAPNRPQQRRQRPQPPGSAESRGNQHSQRWLENLHTAGVTGSIPVSPVNCLAFGVGRRRHSCPGPATARGVVIVTPGESRRANDIQWGEGPMGRSCGAGDRELPSTSSGKSSWECGRAPAMSRGRTGITLTRGSRRRWPGRSCPLEVTAYPLRMEA